MTDLVLDVGCGNHPEGDVNLDLHPEATVHRWGHGEPLQRDKLGLFVRGDALHLPFKLGAFDKVVCHHLIGHLSNPYLLLAELVCACKMGGKVVLTCPHRLGSHVKRGMRRCYFSKAWFLRNLPSMGIRDFSVTYAWRMLLPFIVVPNELKVTIYN